MATFKVNLPAGPLWNQKDAENKAPKIAAAHQGKWTGEWQTVAMSEMSVVEVELHIEHTGTHDFITYVPAGLLESEEEAQKIGPAIATSYGAKFTGKWKTIVGGLMSIIEIKYRF